MGCGDPHCPLKLLKLRPHIEIRLCHVSLPEATIKLPILGWNPIVLLGNSSFRLMSAGSDPSIPLLKTTLLMATSQFLPLNSTVLRLHPPFWMTLTWSHLFWNYKIFVGENERHLWRRYLFLVEIKPMCFRRVIILCSISQEKSYMFNLMYPIIPWFSWWSSNFFEQNSGFCQSTNQPTNSDKAAAFEADLYLQRSAWDPGGILLGDPPFYIFQKRRVWSMTGWWFRLFF